MHINNTGKSPANNVRSYRIMGLARIAKDSPDIAIADKERVCKEARADIGVYGQTIGPGETVGTETPKIILSQEQVDLINKRELQIVVSAGVIYYDIFGKQHETEVCKTTFNDSRAWGTCAVHNTMR
jgi:hypothetical protein